ncbi:hypothetical protein FACS189437_08480 [Bacteroidia bacterium]|nr:hypothetical protein FACS189437_08480 [Bacteroidia bacterium]
MFMQQRRDENLMLVSAVEQYANQYNIPTAVALNLFGKYWINTLIRHHYNALHTQSLDECFHFADDILKRKLNEP